MKTGRPQRRPSPLRGKNLRGWPFERYVISHDIIVYPRKARRNVRW